MRKQILKRVLGFSRPYIGYLVLALISAVLSVGMTLYAPILIGRGIDQIIGPGNVDFKAILSDIAWLAGTVAVGALFHSARIFSPTVRCAICAFPYSISWSECR